MLEILKLPENSIFSKKNTHTKSSLNLMRRKKFNYFLFKTFWKSLSQQFSSNSRKFNENFLSLVYVFFKFVSFCSNTNTEMCIFSALSFLRVSIQFFHFKTQTYQNTILKLLLINIIVWVSIETWCFSRLFF